MVGKLKIGERGPERNVKLVITPGELSSENSSPLGSIDPRSVDRYEISGLQGNESGLVTLTFVLGDGRRVRFYATESKADMVLLLDELDGAIGERRREVARDDA